MGKKGGEIWRKRGENREKRWKKQGKYEIIRKKYGKRGGKQGGKIWRKRGKQGKNTGKIRKKIGEKIREKYEIIRKNMGKKGGER